MRYAVKGGIGDFLQCLPFMLAHPDDRYFVASHYNDVMGFFGHFGLFVEEVPLGQMPSVEPCPRQLFFDRNPFPAASPIFKGSRPVVGVHLGGSSYSLSVEERFGFPPKAIPRTVLEGLVSPDYEFLVFGSPKELDELGEIKGARLVREDSIITSLSRVAECSVLIGSDSSFKTMSAMLRIPTVVLMGDYRDDHRDQRFIDPYVREGVISVFRYRDLTFEINAAVRFCREQLEAKCLAFQT